MKYPTRIFLRTYSNSTSMKPIAMQIVARLLPILLGMLTTGTAFAADANPPEKMAYQGYMTDTNGDPLGATAPANYDTIFRIWSVLEGNASTDLLWSEQQTVTFDKGNFSVLLGEGSDVGSYARGPLKEVFQNSTASDRYIEITVTGLSGGNVVLVPRIKLVSSPYSFLADHARTADRILGVNSSNQTVDVLKVSGENVGIGLADEVTPNAQLDVNGATKLRSTLTVAGETTLQGQINLVGPTLVSGEFSLENNLTINGGTLNVTPASGQSALVLSHTGDGVDHQLRVDMDSEKTWIHGNSEATRLWLGGHPDGGAMGVKNLRLNPYGSVDFATSLRNVEPTSRPHLQFKPKGAGAADWEKSWWIGGIEDQSPNGSHGAHFGWYGGGGNGHAFFGAGPLGGSGTNHTLLTLTPYDNGAAWFRDAWYLGVQRASGDAVAISPLSNGLELWSHALGDLHWLGGSSWQFASDVRLKEDIRDAEPMMDRLMQLPVRRFKWKNKADDQAYDLGVVAQEVEPLFPELVSESSTVPTVPFLPGQNDVQRKSVGYGTFGLLAVKGLQELKAEKDDEIQQLREALAERDARIAELEAGQSKILDLEERLIALTAALQN